MPEVLLNKVLGKVSDVLINGDGEVLPKATDHYLAFMSPGIPLLSDDFNYALEGFGGVYRENVDPEDLVKSVGPQEGGEAAPAAEGTTPPADGDDAAARAAKMALDASTKYQRAEAFQAMCDLIPDTSGIVDSGRINVWNPESRLSSVYARALQMSQVYNVEPDEELKKKIEHWRSLLQVEEKDLVDPEKTRLVPSPMVKAYQEKQLAWLEAAMDYQNTRISALTPTNQEAVHRFATTANLLQTKVRAASNDWVTNGYREEYDRIAAAIESVEGRSYALLKQRYKEDFLRSLLTNPSSGANFLYSAPAPAAFARADSGWTEFSFGSGDFHSASEFKSSSSSAGGGFSIGIFSGGGSGSVKKENFDKEVDASNFRLEMKIARVPIYRPWLHLDFLKSGYWRFDQNNAEIKDQLISDGSGGGQMPAITTECVFVKDLTMHFGESHSDIEANSKTVEGGGGFAVGPFFGGGSHSSTERDREFNSKWSSEGLEIDGLQLLGFICHMLPKSPNPNPDIKDWL